MVTFLHKTDSNRSSSMRTCIFCKEPYSETAHYTIFIEGKFSVVPVPLENRTAGAAHSPGCSAAERSADRGYTGSPVCNR